MNIIKSALKNHQVSLTITFLVLAVGIYSLLNMSRREDPKFTIRQGLVVAPYPGATSSEVEQRVITKIEDLLFSFNEVNKAKTRSTSRNSVGYIVVELEDNVEAPDRFWSKLQLKLQEFKQTSLPETVLGPVVKSDFGDTIALLLGIHSEKRDFTELQHYRSLIEEELRTIPAASKIKEIGGQEEAVYVTGDTKKLAFYGLSLSQVLLAVQGENRVFPNGSIDVGNNNVPFHTQGQYRDLSNVRNQIISSTPSGDVIRLQDVATVGRQLKERDTYMRVNGSPALFLSVEMHEGHNIVSFGKEVEESLAEVEKKLPPDVSVDLLVDQPENVRSSINNFIREFFIALISVVIVTILLLPFRVALITALAIPVTVALTFTSLNGLGIELQQVSLASLIVVLGLLVDDAIVIADEYVEKLSEGLKPYEAAWRAAAELNIPVLTASLTIIGSFFPLIILSGNVGEFIVSLPLTVAIAISASYLVAMLLTPYLCYRFIKEALTEESDDEKSSFNLLDGLQRVYNRSIEKALELPYWSLAIGLLFVLIGVFFLTGIEQKFFPAAERNQFVIELYMPEGTQLEKTNQAARQVEQKLQADHRLADVTTFVGSSAPRFYYNYASKFPQSNFAQFLVNTTSVEATKEWTRALETEIANWVPEGMLLVKQMQQGVPNEAPIEVRVVGHNLEQIRETGAEIEQIFNELPNSYRVTNDFKNDCYGLDIVENKEVANRLGITSGTIARYLAIGFEGLPVSTIYEGDRAVDVILRRDPGARKNFDDIRNTYLTSSITRQPVQLSEVASLQPEWHISNINHRNGIRTLTVLAYTRSGYYPSELLNQAMEKIEQLDLPSGISVEYGGEYESKNETFSEMTVALMISLILIFLVMLFQFRDLKEVGIVLSAIPLCLPGALFGLLVLGYPFGFTAFVGLASLSGITVRNSIILVDYANHLLSEGYSVREAAKLAGERRIRPIFLTTMAASVGVTPMILSGSEMWAPLATALAFGLIFAMFMTLIIVPVLYYLWIDEESSAISSSTAIVLFLVAGSSFLLPSESRAQESATLSETSTPDTVLTIREATRRAMDRNKKLKMARLELENKKIEVSQVRLLGYPRVEANASLFYWYHTERSTTLPVALSSLPIVGDVPPIPFETEVILPEDHYLSGYASVGIFQPISQLFKINTGIKAAEHEVKKAEIKYGRARAKVQFGVTKLYLGLLIQQAKLKEARLGEKLAEEKFRNSNEAVKSGELLEAYEMGLKANRLEKAHQAMKVQNKLNKYRRQLAQLLDLPLDTTLTLQEPSPTFLDSVYQQLSNSSAANDSIRLAQNAYRKAQLGIRASKQDYIPEVTLFATGAYMDGMPLLPHYNALVGVNLRWQIVDWGKRRRETRKSRNLKKQASLNLASVREDQRINNQFMRDEINEAKQLLQAAQQGYEFRQEEFRIKNNALKNELILKEAWLEAKINLSKARRQYLEAQMNLLLKKAEFIQANS